MCPMIATPLTIEWSLLGFIHQRPMYGYELYQEITNHEGLGLVWRLKQSQLYALLTKLETRGYLSYTLESQPPRPPRKVYELTESGRQALLNWIRQPVDHGREFRMEFLAKLYFAQQEGAQITKTLLEQQREICREWLMEQRNLASQDDEKNAYACLVHQFRSGQIQAMLIWLDTCEKSLINTEEKLQL